MHRRRVVAALARDHNVATRKRAYIGRIEQTRRTAADVGTRTADVRRAEEKRVDQCEIALGRHPLHEHRAHHPTPADEPDSHRVAPLETQTMAHECITRAL